MPRSAVLVFAIGILLAVAYRKDQHKPANNPLTQNLPSHTTPTPLGNPSWIMDTYVRYNTI